MKLAPERRSPRLPRHVWVVLVGSISAILTLNLAGVVYAYHAWEADSGLAGPAASMARDTLLWGWTHVSSFLGLLTLLGWALAWRGRRVLFAAPALSLAFVPILVGLLQGSRHLIPGLVGGFQDLGYDYGEWVFWVEAAVKLVLVLVPGFVLARRVEPLPRNPFRLLSVALMTLPASIVIYYGVVYLSANGRLEGDTGASYVAAFCLGVAMGFDRPLWPWLIAVVPSFVGSWVQPLFGSDGSGYLMLVLITLLGASTVSLSRKYQRAFTDPDSSHSLSSAAG